MRFMAEQTAAPINRPPARIHITVAVGTGADTAAKPQMNSANAKVAKILARSERTFLRRAISRSLGALRR